MTFAFSSFPIMMRQISWRPELVLTVAPALVCAPAGLLTARLCGAQSWLHLQDFEVDLAFQMDLLKGKLLQRLILHAERWMLQRFDNVSSISSRMVERLLVKGVDQKRTRYFPNWVDVGDIKPTLSGAKYRESLGIDSAAIVVLYSGSLGGKQGLMVIPEVAGLVAHRTDIVFVVCGDGVMKPQLQAATKNMTNVHFLPLQPFERLGELLCMADIHLLPQNSGAADLVLPSKLAGMMASGRPVLATCCAGTEISDVVSTCGLVVEPLDANALAAALLELADNPELRSEMGRNARAYAEANFECDSILNRMFGRVEDTLSVVVDDAIA